MGNTVFDRECQAIQTGFPAMTNTLIKQKRGITMDAQTRGLLRECSLGCKMAINSFNQMRDYVKNEELKELMDTYDKKHKAYEEKAAKMLIEDGSKEKEPGMMASAFSKMTTEMKLMMKDDSSQVAKLVMDGCNMGIQTLGGYINEYKNASGQSMNLAKDIVRTEESLMKDMQKFL